MPRDFYDNVNMQSNRITDMSDPINQQDAITKNYGDTNYTDGSNLLNVKRFYSFGSIDQVFIGVTDLPIFSVFPEPNSSIYNVISDTELEITEAGSYFLQYSINVDLTLGNNRSKSNIYLLVNGTIISDMTRGGYHRNSSEGENTITSILRPITLAVGDRIKVQGEKISGNSTLVALANGYSFTMFTIQAQSSIIAPSITSFSNNIIINEGESFNQLNSASGTGITWSLSGEPVGMTINSITGEINYIGVIGIYNGIQVIATNTAGMDSFTFNLTVNALIIPLDNLVRFFNPEVGITKNGSEIVSSWSDQANLGDNATQNSNQRRPLHDISTYTSSTLSCDGNDNMVLPATDIYSGEFSIFIVLNSDNGSRDSYFLADTTGNNFLGHDSSGTRQFKIDGNEIKSGAAEWISGTPVVYHLSRDVSNNLYISSNDGGDINLGVITGNLTLTNILGSSIDINKSHDGFIGDILMYSIKRSNSDVTAIVNILRSKYGI